MLCEMCRQRPANVHETHATIRLGSRITTSRDLCEVCAGRKTEVQWQAEEVERREQINAQKERKKGAATALSAVIRGELFNPRKAELQNAHFRTYGRCIDSDWQLCLLVVGSESSMADPVEALFGVKEKGKTHVVRQVIGCEVHVVRWDADPVRLMGNIFLPFPTAGARLDLSKRLLLVDRELDLFPNSFRSLTFCSLAAGAISLSSAVSEERVRYQFRTQNAPTPPSE